MPILPIFDSDRVHLHELLIYFATEDADTASKAVLYAMMALSAFIRDGEQIHAAHYKLLALEALMAAPSELSTRCAIKHIVVGILLCIFEVCFLTSSSCVS